ncbi:MAG: transglutaminase [candidate division Zixibacteria bacterium]|nr:transglutaminase [candidate division Zixibacteria bacterium]
MGGGCLRNPKTISCRIRDPFIRTTRCGMRCPKTVWLGIVAIMMLASSVQAAPGDTTRSLPSPSPCPQGLTYDGSQIWCVDRRSDFLYRVDPGNGAVTDSLPSPGYVPRGLTWDGTYLWCIDAGEEQVYAIDPETQIVERTIPCPVSRPSGLTWDGEYLWLADYGDDQLHQISTEDGTTIMSLPAPSGDPCGLAFDGSYLWVSDRSKDEIYAVTPDTGAVVITLHAPAPHAWGLAWDGSRLWNVDYQTDRIYEVVVRDGDPYARFEVKLEDVEFIHQVRNYGPDTVKTLDVYLAIPENRDTQELIGPVVFDPEPDAIRTDKWGQKVAHFRFTDMPPSEATLVRMNASAKLYQVQYYVYPDQVGTLDDIPADIRGQYLVDDAKFALESSIIKNALEAAVGEETNPYWIARNIYQYVIDHMEYELAGGWNIAPMVLNRGNGSCSEYTFVYISLCRSAGIPARYAGSLVIRGDDASYDEVFHRWVEVYLPNVGWIPVDPSRGDKRWSAQRANSFGYLNNRFLITTVGGGGSEYLEWGYNANERWTSKGRCKVAVEAFAEWSPRPDVEE